MVVVTSSLWSSRSLPFLPCNQFCRFRRPLRDTFTLFIFGCTLPSPISTADLHLFLDAVLIAIGAKRAEHLSTFTFFCSQNVGLSSLASILWLSSLSTGSPSTLLHRPLLGPLLGGLAKTSRVLVELQHNVRLHAVFAVGRGEQTEDGKEQLKNRKKRKGKTILEAKPPKQTSNILPVQWSAPGSTCCRGRSGRWSHLGGGGGGERESLFSQLNFERRTHHHHHKSPTYLD